MLRPFAFVPLAESEIKISILTPQKTRRPPIVKKWRYMKRCPTLVAIFATRCASQRPRQVR